MLKVGFVGWRGMVGSVLMDRMKTENDFQGIELQPNHQATMASKPRKHRCKRRWTKT